VQTMTLDEKLAISNKACLLLKGGDREEYNRLMKLIPVPPLVAEAVKEVIGADFLIEGGWNLSEAEARFGSDWISH